MPSTTAICSTFKRQLFEADHDFKVAGDAFYWALYTSAANNDAASTAYTATGEIAATGGYTAGGMTTANAAPALAGVTAHVDWPTDPIWPSATITAASTMLYNSTAAAANASCAVWDFGGDQTSSGGDFVLQLPAPGASGILTLA